MVVDKRRRLLLWRYVRIHLDAVEGLGSFVELEAVAPAGEPPSEDDAGAVARLREVLRIHDEALVAVGYADLLLGTEGA